MSNFPNVLNARGSQNLSPAPNVPWRDLPGMGGLANGYAHFVSGLRIASETFSEIWAGVAAVRTLPNILGAGGTLTVVSTDATDTVAGTGANVVMVSYIEAGTLFERLGLANLNGVTPAAVVKATYNPATGAFTPTATPVTDAVRVNETRVILAGAGAPPANKWTDGNAGRIDTSIGANVQTSFLRGSRNLSNGAFYFVPRGFQGLLTGISTSTIDLSALFFSLRIQFYRRAGGAVVRPLPGYAPLDVAGGFGNISEDLGTPRLLPPMTDISLRMSNTPAAALQISGSLSFVLLNDLDDPDPNPELQPPKFSGGGR